MTRFLDAQRGARRLAPFVVFETVLEHHDILHLPNAPIIIVPARQGYYRRFQSAFFHAKFVAPYTGVDVHGAIGIDNVSDNIAMMTVEATRKQFLGDAWIGAFGYDDGAVSSIDMTTLAPEGGPSIFQSGGPYPFSRAHNQPIRIFANQDDSGEDFGGGHRDNLLLVRTYCVDERLIPSPLFT